MEVFVSHSFKDEQLATMLVDTLGASGIKGYMAQRAKEYELLIRDKIKDEISRSSCLIAIITKNSIESPSVFEEIGYAMGKGVPVVVMREEEVKTGVLTHGLETEDFKHELFKEVACKNITNYLLRMGNKNKSTELILSDDFLKKKRLIWEHEREEYGINDSADSLFDWVTEGKAVANTYRHFVQFSACPKHLLEDIDLHSEDFSEWLQYNKNISLDGRKYNWLPRTLIEKIGLGRRSFNQYLREDKLTRYVELYNNGFVQEGLSFRLIRPVAEMAKAALHLCWTTGAFWSFVIFCRQYYAYLKVKDEIDIFFTVHAVKDLSLFGFGGTTAAGKWAEPYSPHYGAGFPETPLFNVVLHEKIRSDATDSEIAKMIRRTSDKVSNAFGISSSRCYNKDGSFNFEMFSYYWD